MRKKSLIAVSFAVIIVLLISACTGKNSFPEVQPTPEIQKLVIAGSGTNLPITGKLIEAYTGKFHENIKLPNSIGTGGAVKAVADGVIDLGLASRALTEDEKNKGLKEIPYSRVGIVIGANSSVSDNEITYTQLVNIFEGQETSWGNGKMIIVLSREEGDSSNMVLEREIPGFAKALQESFAEHRWQVMYTDAAEAEAIVNTPFSIGLTDTGTLAAWKTAIKPLKVNGVEPTTDSLKNGSYKLYKEIYFIYQEPLSPDVQRFLDFVFSEEGAAVISANGGIPLKGR